jgi:phosphate starvation-inducible protein PhoH
MKMFLTRLGEVAHSHHRRHADAVAARCQFGLHDANELLSHIESVQVLHQGRGAPVLFVAAIVKAYEADEPAT